MSSVVPFGKVSLEFQFVLTKPAAERAQRLDRACGGDHAWRALSWEVIHAAEARDPPAPGSVGQGKAENQPP